MAYCWMGHEYQGGGSCPRCAAEKAAEEQKRHNRAVEKELQQQRRDAEELQQQRRHAEFERDIDWDLQPTPEIRRAMEKWDEEQRQQREQERNRGKFAHEIATVQVTTKVERQRFPKSLPYWILGIFGLWLATLLQPRKQNVRPTLPPPMASCRSNEDPTAYDKIVIPPYARNFALRLPVGCQTKRIKFPNHLGYYNVKTADKFRFDCPLKPYCPGVMYPPEEADKNKWGPNPPESGMWVSYENLEKHDIEIFLIFGYYK